MCVNVKLMCYNDTYKVNHTKEPLGFLLFCIFLFNDIFSAFINNSDTWNLRHLHLYRLTFVIVDAERPRKLGGRVLTRMEHGTFGGVELKSATVAASTPRARPAARCGRGVPRAQRVGSSGT